MELKAALTARRASPRTPLNADAWEHELRITGLLARYPLIPRSIRLGFDIGIRPISTTFTPPNRPTVLDNIDAFRELVRKERQLGRYYGPFTRSEVESLIGPFQTSPFSLIPKPHKPQVLRLIQNLSYPRNPLPTGISSINSSIDASEYPCTWGTFTAISLVLASLPPGLQAACRDVSEAFRSIPLHPSQWPGVVARTSEDEYDIDVCAMFGGRSCVGVYGMVADAGADIMRAHGIGPLLKWVDDHLFLRILRQHLAEFNKRRAETRQRIETAGGRRHRGGRLWYEGGLLPDDSIEEFVEDFVFPLVDLATTSVRSQEDAAFTYAHTPSDIPLSDDTVIENQHLEA